MILSDKDNDYETDDIDESSMMMLPQVQWIQRLCAIWGEAADYCSCAHLRFLKKVIVMMMTFTPTMQMSILIMLI